MISLPSIFDINLDPENMDAYNNESRAKLLYTLLLAGFTQIVTNNTR